jgi:murein DD-endopeptidase MepM/ murein hydrolase activator NlpD
MATYTVQKGDTLSAIGQRFGVPYQQITGYRSGDPNLIYPNEVLTIPEKTAPISPVVVPTAPISQTPSIVPSPISTTPVRTPSPYEDVLTKISNQLDEQQRSYEESRKGAREALNAQLQSRLAEIDRLTSQRVQSEQEQGARDLARARGINIRAGLIGSDFGEARKTNVEKATQKAISEAQAMGAEKRASVSADVSAALQTLEDKYNERISGITKERQGLLLKGLDFQKESQKESLEAFNTIAKSGNTDFNKIKSSGLLQEVMTQTGKDEKTLEFLFNAQLPKAQQSDFKFQEVGNDVWVWQFIPQTGEFKRRTDLDQKGVAKGAGEFSITTTPDGTVLLIPKNFDPTKSPQSQIVQYGSQGQFAKPSGTTTSGNVLKTPNGSQIPELQYNAYTRAKDLLQKFNERKGTTAVGRTGILGTFGYGLIPGTKRADFINMYEGLVADLALDAVKYLKGQGQVSDAERRLLANAATTLKLNSSEDEFRKILTGVISAIKKNYGLGDEPLITNFQVGSVVNDISNLPDGTVIEENGVYYTIRDGQKIPQ